MRQILAAHAGGLGDALIWSTLPELYARRGDEVFIASKPAFRNDETAQLVWGTNPFVSGFADEAPTIGFPQARAFLKDCKRFGTSIAAIEAAHGFAPSSVLPQIYHQPTFRRDWANVVVADPRSISQPIAPQAFDAFVRHIARAHDFEPADVVVLDSAHSGPHGAGVLRGNSKHRVASIFEYADIIFSCRRFLVAESGGQVLASAIRRQRPFPVVHSLFTSMGWNDRAFTFPNVEYCVTGAMTIDYLVHP